MNRIETEGQRLSGQSSATEAHDKGALREDSSPLARAVLRRKIQRRVAQRHRAEEAHDEAQIQSAAAEGTQGAGGSLPHLDAIQKSFGRHDVSGIEAHTDDKAQAASQQMGAEAFATGNHVAFAGAPGLHTAAHEAAHIVQQRAGVSLKGGVGQEGDAYERHADAVADRVVKGESAEALLDAHTGSGTPVSGAAQRKVVQREKREKEDLDYGFSGPRAKAMEHASNTGNDDRGNVCPTVDDLNAEGGVTTFMQDFKFHDLLTYISSYSKVEAAQPTDEEKHVVAWVLFLKKNLARINLSKQVNEATRSILPTEATKDRLNKNKHRKLGAPDPQTIRDWYDSKGATIPGDADDKERLEEWVWNAFFRITSKLGLEFTAERNAAIHFNISRDAYTKALASRDPGAKHGRSAITHSELRHLKKLQDRGKAPTVHFQDNSPNVHDVDAPFKSLDMLDAGGVSRLYQTPQWKTESVKYETRLGVYANNRPEAKKAAQDGLTKMDSVLAKKNHSKKKSDYQKHRQVFGKEDVSSAGQVGVDPDTIRSVIKGTPKMGEDDVNMREQMTAFYNAGLWNAKRGTTIKKVLTEVGQIEDPQARKDAAANLGIDETQINAVHALIRTQIQNTQDKIDQISKLPSKQRLAKVKSDFKLDDVKGATMVSQIHALNKEKRDYRREGDRTERKNKKDAYITNKWDLAKTHTDINILATNIDTDDSRPARVKRDGPDRDTNKKSSKDYTDMGVPLSNREKASIGGVADESAKLPWVEGVAYFSIDETTGWGKEMKEKGMPTVAGNSGTAARLMKIFLWLGAGNPIDFRLALLGWMLTSRDHSLLEILQGVMTVGVSGGENLDSPVEMYKNVAPLNTADLRTSVAEGNKFPEERVLEQVDDLTYKSLIKQG